MATTIKVSEELRDRLNQDARVEGVTPSVLIARLLDEADRRRRMAAFGRSFSGADAQYWQEFCAWNQPLDDSGVERG